MEMQNLVPKEKNLSGMLCQEVMEILHALRFKCENKDTDSLGFTVPIFIGLTPVVTFIATTEQGVELSSQWPDRPAKTHYLLKAGFVNFSMMKECLQILEAIWKIILSQPANPEMQNRDWDQEIKEAITGLRALREARLKMFNQMEETAEAIHGKPTPQADNGAQITGGIDIHVVSQDEAERRKTMQEIEEEQI